MTEITRRSQDYRRGYKAGYWAGILHGGQVLIAKAEDHLVRLERDHATLMQERAKCDQRLAVVQADVARIEVKLQERQP